MVSLHRRALTGTHGASSCRREKQVTVPRRFCAAHSRRVRVSILSWRAYVASVLLWSWHGVRTRDENIYLLIYG
jgi:hypothetical protein